MSNHPRGILAYGYDLGGPDSGWKCENENPNRSLRDIIENADDVFAIAGIGNVSVVMYSSWDYPSFIIASQHFKAGDWGSCVVEPFLDHSAFERLLRACKILKIKPNQQEPKWILASFYG